MSIRFDVLRTFTVPITLETVARIRGV